MSQTLGEKLRIAREERGISISEVAEQTRISPLYLEAIDADDFKTLPGGIFNKGFIRSYAKYVGFDEQEALKDYNRFVAEEEAKEDGSMKSYRPEVLTDDQTVSSFIPTLIFAAIILGLMTAGILVLVSYIQNQQTDNQAAVNTPAASNAEAPVAGTNTAAPGPASQVPSMAALKVEFTTNGEDIWLNSVSDGTSGSAVVSANSPATFEPKEQLRLSYSKSLAESARLSINGRSIALPKEPANPRRQLIEIDLNQGNVAAIWQAGSFDVGEPAAASDANTATTAETTTRSTPRLAASDAPQPADEGNSNAASPTATVPTMTNRPVMTNRANTRPQPSPAANRPPANRPAANRPANTERP